MNAATELSFNKITVFSEETESKSVKQVEIKPLSNGKFFFFFFLSEKNIELVYFVMK